MYCYILNAALNVLEFNIKRAEHRERAERIQHQSVVHKQKIIL